MKYVAIVFLSLWLAAAGFNRSQAPAQDNPRPVQTGETGEENLPQPDPEDYNFDPPAGDAKREVVGRVTEVADDRLKLNLGIDFDITEGDTLDIYRRIQVVNTLTDRKVKLTWRVGKVVIHESAGSSSIGRLLSPDPDDRPMIDDEIRVVVPEAVIRAGTGKKDRQRE
ncbi:hypothetical protein ACFLT7_00850 [candidate division KSB1 bacterium]